MPSIKIGNFRLSIINESKSINKYTYNSITQAAQAAQAESLELEMRNEKIYELHLKGLKQIEIAEEVGIKQARVSVILRKKFGIVSKDRKGVRDNYYRKRFNVVQ